MVKRTVSQNLKLGMAIYETVMAIPIFGFLISLLIFPILLGLAGHIVTLVFSHKEKKKIFPSVMGIIASALGWIPFAGWVLHILAAIFNWVGAFKH